MKNKNLLYFLIPLGVILLILLVYFNPILGGKKLFQQDIMQYRGGAQEQIEYRKAHGSDTYWSDSMFGGMPTFQSGAQYPYNYLKSIDKFFGAFLPQPLNFFFLAFGGFFLLTYIFLKDWKYALAGALFFGFSTYFFQITEAGHNAKIHTIAYFAPFLAGVLLIFKRNFYWGFLLTTLFLALQLNANHPQMTYYLFIGLFALGVYELYNTIKSKKWVPFFQSVSLFILALALSLGMNAARLLSTYEYGQETTRGKSQLNQNSDSNEGLSTDYITDWSYGILETGNLMIPNLMGGGSQEDGFEPEKFSYAQKQLEQKFYTRAEPFLVKKDSIAKALQQDPQNEDLRQSYAAIDGEINKISDAYGKAIKGYSGSYWGNQPFTSGPAYQGVIVVFLGIMSMIWYKNPNKWWLLGATVLSFMMAWGKNFSLFTDTMIAYFPFYNKFRAVSSALVVAELTIPILAILGLHSFLKPNSENSEKNKKSLLIAGGISVFVFIILYFFGNQILPFHNSTEQENMSSDLLEAISSDRYEFFKKDLLRTIFILLLAIAALYVYTLGKIKEGGYVLLVVVLLSTIDLWTVDKRYLNNDSFVASKYMNNPFPTEVTEGMQADLEKQPKLQSMFALAKMNFVLNDIKEKDKSNYRVFNTVLNPFQENNTSYFHHSVGGYHGAKLSAYQDLIDGYLSQQPNLEVLNMLNTKYVLLGDAQQPQAIPNTENNGNAWFVSQIIEANSVDEEFKNLANFHSKKEAIVNAKEKIAKSFQADSTASITLDSYQPNKLVYKTQSSTEQFAVFSEIFYPHGWEASIDGKNANIVKTNYLLRGLVVPSGAHTIEFNFQPKVVELGSLTQLLSLIMFILMVVIGYYFSVMRKNNNSEKIIEPDTAT